MEELLLEDVLFEDLFTCEDTCPPPPVMLIPSPPPPPWMDKVPDCSPDGHCSNYPAITSINSVTSIFHMTSVVSVIAITSFVIFFISVLLITR